MNRPLIAAPRSQIGLLLKYVINIPMFFYWGQIFCLCFQGSICKISYFARNNYQTVTCTFIDLIRVDDYNLREGDSVTLTDSSYTLRKSDIVSLLYIFKYLLNFQACLNSLGSSFLPFTSHKHSMEICISRYTTRFRYSQSAWMVKIIFRCT